MNLAVIFVVLLVDRLLVRTKEMRGVLDQKKHRPLGHVNNLLDHTTVDSDAFLPDPCKWRLWQMTMQPNDVKISAAFRNALEVCCIRPGLAIVRLNVRSIVPPGKGCWPVVVCGHFETNCKKVISFHPPAITNKWVTKRGVSSEYLRFFDEDLLTARPPVILLKESTRRRMNSKRFLR